MDVTLHIGAHRTGTTTLQNYLEKNRDNLREIGTEYWGAKQTRSGLFTGFEKRLSAQTNEEIGYGKKSSGLIRDMLARLEEDGVKSLIVSEENMLGSIGGNVRDGSLYNEASGLLQRFTPGFGGHCNRVALSIRSYDEYWASVFNFVTQRGGKLLSKQKMDELAAQPRRWRDIITEVSGIFPSAELIVWSFEATLDRESDKLALLNGGRVPKQMHAQKQWHNASVSSTKLRQMLETSGRSGLAAGVPEGTTRWQPFAADQVATFQEQYREDIAWLRSGADGIAKFEDNPK